MTVAEVGFRTFVFVAVEFRFPNTIPSGLLFRRHLHTYDRWFLYRESGMRRIPFVFSAILLVLFDGCWVVHSLLILSCVV